jgi:transglutaminase-like putative cysteine protease
MIPKAVAAFAAALVLLATLAAGALPPLQAPPAGTRWFSIRMNDERSGFARSELRKEGDGYLLTGESGVKMVVMGFSREATAKEMYLLDPKLGIVSGTVEEVLDGSRMRLTLRAEPRGIAVVTETGGKRQERLLKAKGPVYPMWAANLYPLLQGFVAGKKYVMQAFDPEGPAVKKVKITAVGIEKAPDGSELFHLRNDLYPVVDNDIWVDREGNTVRESVRDGLVVTEAEEPEKGARSLAEAAVSRRDMALEFSLVPSPEPLKAPEKLTRLMLTFAGFPPDFAVPVSPRQEAKRLPDGTTIVTIIAAKRDPAAPGVPDFRYLQATEGIPVGDPEIAAAAKEVVGNEAEAARKVEKLTWWVSKRVEGAVTDAHSALETLRTGKGNCQAHARLYLALARAAGIPSRMVSGLVWVPEKGFLYHSWAESLADGNWISIDPTFGQVPADATHVKLVEGDSTDDLVPLVRVIGKLRILSLQQEEPGAGEPEKVIVHPPHHSKSEVQRG